MALLDFCFHQFPYYKCRRNDRHFDDVLKCDHEMCVHNVYVCYQLKQNKKDKLICKKYGKNSCFKLKHVLLKMNLPKIIKFIETKITNKYIYIYISENCVTEK